MASDYNSIRKDNERKYGTDIGRTGPMLLAKRYADRTHFIFELLQNAEDALARRDNWEGSRSVAFHLLSDTLRVSHFGEPFDEGDVRGICGIAESTKELTDIGRFGIGFKSVYEITDRPEIHSGSESFAIDTYVWPTSIVTAETKEDETVFVLPLREEVAEIHADIIEGFRRLGPRTLLFLRQIEEISWNVEGGPSGLYLRSKPEMLSEGVRKVTVIGEEEGLPDVEETWLVFSREVRGDDDVLAGHVEIAFSTIDDEESEEWMVQPVTDSPLVVFFPTVIQTNLGFIVQGPYRTTPSRDNIPQKDRWNQKLSMMTAELVVDALRWMRDNDVLTLDVFQCLPLDRNKFPEGSIFAILHYAIRIALKDEPLLPRFGGGYLSGSEAMLARSSDLRELFTPDQFSTLFGVNGKQGWISGEITPNSYREVRSYLMSELHIEEARPETILPKLNKMFLEGQSDEWIVRLYEFLNGQSYLIGLGVTRSLPLIRLETGEHVAPQSEGIARAFLPGSTKTSFPTVRRAVCSTSDARKFLESLGLTEPDPVDDIIWNILPKYGSEEINVDDEQYDADIQRILAAFSGTDSKSQREKLIESLKKSPFVSVVDSGNGSKWYSVPERVYLATEQLKVLFEGVADVLLVDDSYDCLRGEQARDMLVACGVARYLRPVPVQVKGQKRQQLREMAETTASRSSETIEDFSIAGLEELISTLPAFSSDQRRRKAELLWEALSDLEQRSRSVFTGTYRGQYYGPRRCDFEPSFIELLHSAAWVTDAGGELQRTDLVIFDNLGWKPNPFLLSKFRFKPQIVETLAREAGFEPSMLDLLKRLGVTSESELRIRLRLPDESETSGEDVDNALKNILGNVPEPSPPVSGPTFAGSSGSSGAGTGTGSRGSGHGRTGTATGAHGGGGKRSPGSTGGRPFISYVATYPDDEDGDHDGLDQQTRNQLEERAIELILAREPELRQTPTHNPGYDLFEADEDNRPVRWIEVKAMTGGLNDRPVGLSHTQFECARDHGDAFWLYAVEHTADAATARIVRIQNPAGKARTFTFDHGWLDVAEIDSEQKDDEE